MTGNVVFSGFGQAFRKTMAAHRLQGFGKTARLAIAVIDDQRRTALGGDDAGKLLRKRG